MTSDACGSLPDFDEKGNLIKLEIGFPKSILTEMIDTVKNEGLPLEKALKVITSNIADALKLKQKGRIEVGKDADVVLFDQSFHICHMVAMGNMMVKDKKMLRKGSYEK
jgi:beta-aspartyl-dipeptidase (metallo-type)